MGDCMMAEGLPAIDTIVRVGYLNHAVSQHNISERRRKSVKIILCYSKLLSLSLSLSICRGCRWMSSCPSICHFMM